MKTLLIATGGAPPPELREIVAAGSTELDEIAHDPRSVNTPVDADRVVIWTGAHLVVEDRVLRWPDDEDELRLLFQSAG